MMTLTETMVERQMTNTDQNLPPRRELPISTVQLAAVTSDAVIGGLARSPYLLGLIVLTAFGIGAAVYFLNILISGQQNYLKALLEQQTRQQTELLAMHKSEFEALLEMSNRLTAVPPPSPIAPNSPILQQPVTPPRR
jgi:glucan phosphoethanolaminetransferase (alkaline phosphatase superfamily)